MPLIPGINDDADNLKQLADFLTTIGQPSIEIMPYHQFGRGKYAATGREYKMGDRTAATPGDVKNACHLLSDEGIGCSVLL